MLTANDDRGAAENTDASDLSDSALGVPEQDVDTDESVQSGTDSNEEGTESTPTKATNFGGLPFKSVDEFVSGHKSLQEGYRQAKTELYQLQEQMRQIQPLLQQLQTQKASPAVEEALDIPAFLETFIQQGPKAIDAIADKRFETLMKKFTETSVTPLQNELTRMKGEREIDKFLGENPHLDDTDEEALLDICRSVPWIKGMQGTVYDKLDAALSVLTRKEPTRWSGRSDASSSKGKTSLANMKQSASSVGVKAGTRQRAQRDEFDEVLDKDSTERQLWG